MMTDKIKKSIPERLFKNIAKIVEDEKSLTVEIKKPGSEAKGQVFDLTKDYFRVVTNKEESKAEIYLYGWIGQDFWWDEGLKEESITDLAFIKAIKDLEADYDRIDIRINSPGGSVFHGDPIINAIRQSKAEIHTYNDGLVASMAFDIWLVGDVRHMALNAKAMCHSTATIEMGTAKDMRAAADRLDKFDDSAIATFAAVTDMEKDEIRAMFYDYEDHWLTADDVNDLGLIVEVENYETNDVTEKKVVTEMVKEFMKEEPPNKKLDVEIKLENIEISEDGEVEDVEVSVKTQVEEKITPLTIREHQMGLIDSSLILFNF